MARRYPPNNSTRRKPRPSSDVIPKQRQKTFTKIKRGRRAGNKQDNSYLPPEDWHEPEGSRSTDFSVITQEPGPGFRHTVTAEEVRDRLMQLPSHFVAPLEVVQLSKMTRKKRSFPCYGMQWGTALYLYPLEEELVEYFDRPPLPAEYNETRQFGGKWKQEGAYWQLIWTEATIKDFFLNNVLIHELGHLLDERNASYRDRERFAEWFALEYGYKPTRTK